MLRAALLALLVGLVRGQDSTVGTNFVLMFMQNIVEYTQPRPVELFFTNLGSQTAYVTVELPGCPIMPKVIGPDTCFFSYSANVSAGSSQRLKLCSGIRHTYADGNVASKAVTVSSTAPIRVFGYNSDTFSADSFVVTQVEDLGRTHIVSSYSPANIATQFGVVAHTDTNVFVAISPSRMDHVVIDYQGVRYTNGDFFRAQVRKYDTLLFYSVSDLSGVVVSGDKPIAVFSGNVRAFVDGSRTSRDHLVEQVIPAAQLGYQYVFQPTPRNDISLNADVVRFTARLPNANVQLYWDNGTDSFTLQDVGTVQERSLSKVTHIKSDVPLSVSVIVRSQNGAAAASTDPADPSLYFLPDITRYPPVNAIAPSFVYSVTNGSFNISFLLISVAQSQINGFSIDSVNLTGVQWVCPTNPAAFPYCSAAVYIAPGSAHRITHNDRTARAAIVLYSAADRESAATLLGISLNGPCREKDHKMGDGIDNDCDGQVDEELCEGTDDDHDLLIDEDCKAGAVTSSGSEYAVVFMSNDINDNTNAITQLELYVAPVRRNVTVTVSSPHGNFFIRKTAPVNAATQIEINSTFLLGFEKDFGFSRQTDKGIYVSADDDIVLYGINKRTYSTDGFISFPLSAAGKVYYAVTSFPINRVDDRCQIAIVSHENGANDITVTLKAGVEIIINSLVYTGPTQFVLPTFNRMEAWELQSVNDLTGTRIESPSGKKFSVYSGNTRHRITLAQTSRDHIVEQMPPKSTWGKTFSSIASPRRFNVGDIWKVVAGASNTVINYWYLVLNTQQVINAQINLTSESDFAVIDPGVGAAIHIESNNPILVTQIVKSTQDYIRERTDPALILIPPLEQWGNDYLFVTPKSGQLIARVQIPYENYIFLVVDRNYRSGLSLVGPTGVSTPLGALTSWVDVPQSTHQALIYPVEDGQNKITHTNASAVYMGIMFGVQDRESYGQAVGLRLATICQPSIMIPGDRVDNDCDGLVDEELIDKLDNDGDGRIDEDCYALPALDVVYVVVYEENAVEYPRYYPLELYIGNEGSSDVYCNIKSNSAAGPSYDVTVKIPSSGVKTFAFAPTLRVIGTRKSTKSFTVFCNTKVTVFGVNKETWSNDGFTVFPLSALGNSYYTVNYGPSQLSSQFAVVAAEAGVTNIAIKFASSVVYAGLFYPAGSSLSLTLRKYEVFQAQSGGDLTGSYVSSDKRIAVFSGDVRTRVELSNSRDHLVSQLPPTDSWGTVFNLAPSPGRTVGDLYRIISVDDSNSVALCCNASNPPQRFTLQKGGWVELSLSSSSFCHLTATKPALVARIMKSQNGPLASELSDPCLTLVSPVSQYGKSATVTPPLYTGGLVGRNTDYTNYLTIIVQKGTQQNLLINGNPPDNVNEFGRPVVWTDVPCSTYTAGAIKLDSSVRHFQVTHRTSSVDFSVLLSGGADRESYCVTLSHVLPDRP